MLLYPRRAEVVAPAANGNDQRVVGKGAFRSNRSPLIVIGRGEEHPPVGPVEADHLAIAVPEVVPMRLC